MSNATLYIATILIWGSSFYAIRLQVPAVEPETSIFYRFALATLILLVFCIVRRKAMKFSILHHIRFAVLGIFLFNLNFLFIYLAADFMATGIVSVIFSSVVVFNMILGKWLLHDRLSLRMIFGALTGIIGLAIIFVPDAMLAENESIALRGVLYALVGTLFASLGMISSGLSQRAGLPIIQANTYGMLYGAAFMLMWILFRDVPFRFPLTPDFVGSLVFLSLFASVLAFSFFLTLVGRLGAGKAGYATVLFPIIGLALSVWLEDYVISATALLGITLAIAGNAMILSDRVRRSD
ncbi:MAG: DMT family transporter [Pseudomonadota bacterium]